MQKQQGKWPNEQKSAAKPMKEKIISIISKQSSAVSSAATVVIIGGGGFINLKWS